MRADYSRVGSDLSITRPGSYPIKDCKPYCLPHRMCSSEPGWKVCTDCGKVHRGDFED